jgi:hypothetical protein
MVRLIGIEPTHPAPEAGALSTELQAHTFSKNIVLIYYSKLLEKKQGVFEIFLIFFAAAAYSPEIGNTQRPFVWFSLPQTELL